jgi:predicted metal-dependent peptidase
MIPLIKLEIEEIVTNHYKKEEPRRKKDYVDLDSSISYIPHSPGSSKDLKGRRKEYQALRDFCLYKEPVNVQENYMELVVQFGYVILFG